MPAEATMTHEAVGEVAGDASDVRRVATDLGTMPVPVIPTTMPAAPALVPIDRCVIEVDGAGRAVVGDATGQEQSGRDECDCLGRCLGAVHCSLLERLTGGRRHRHSG